MRHFKNLLFVAVATLSSAPVFAEVSDKMASPILASVLATAVTAVAFYVCFSLPRALLIVLPLLLLAAWYIGSGEADILASYKLEVDSAAYYRYRAGWIVPGVLMPLGAVLGAILGSRRRRRNAA